MSGSTSQRAQTMKLQNVANHVVRVMLATPLLNRAVGSRLITLYVVGRKSGRHFSVPVAYTEYRGKLLLGTPFAWGKNLQTGTPVEIRFRGDRRTADVEVFTDEASVVEHYTVICRGNEQFAKFNTIGIDADGEPNAEDLRATWQAGARSFLLEPR